MRANIWLSVSCSCCGAVIGWYYSNAKSVSQLKKATKNWVFDKEYGNLCPECWEKLKKRRSDNHDGE